VHALEVPRRIGVVGHPRYSTLPTTLRQLTHIARQEGLELFFEKELQQLSVSGELLTDDAVVELDMLLTLGGDGTLLRGARSVAPFGIPVLGVNFGHLGFLTSVAPEELEQALHAVAAGRVFFDERMVLSVVAQTVTGEVRGEFLALNDAVLHRGGVARMIRMSVRAHGEEVGTYSADGIILATPTGSTAYSLSAGGPIVSPSVHCIIATPISPHTLAVRPLVLPADETVTVEVLSPEEHIILTVDGQVGAMLAPGDRLVVRRAPLPLRLVRLEGQTFFSTLRRKLRWGGLEEREEQTQL
jgi:NAD+ kinase